MTYVDVDQLQVSRALFQVSTQPRDFRRWVGPTKLSEDADKRIFSANPYNR